jgi:hypothetical protein
MAATAHLIHRFTWMQPRIEKLLRLDMTNGIIEFIGHINPIRRPTHLTLIATLCGIQYTSTILVHAAEMIGTRHVRLLFTAAAAAPTD